MKKIISLVLTAIVLLTGITFTTSANNVIWDLAEMPDFADYILVDYGDVSNPSNAILLGTSEAQYSDDELETLSQNIINKINKIMFLPDKSINNIDTNKFVLLLHFDKENWKSERSPAYQILVMENGIYFSKNIRDTSEQHVAFVPCYTDTLVEEIQNITKDMVATVNIVRQENDKTVQEEKDSNTTELISFEKLYSLYIPKLELNSNSGQIVLNFEFGICSYKKASDNVLNHKFYFGLSDEATKTFYYYMSNSTNFENSISYLEDRIYQDNNDGKYYLYSDNSLKTRNLTTTLYTDDDKNLKEIGIVASASNYAATIEVKNLDASGIFKEYGNLKIAAGTYNSEIKEDSTNETTETTPEKEPAKEEMQEEVKAEQPKEEVIEEEKTEEKTEIKEEVTEEKQEEIIEKETPQFQKRATFNDVPTTHWAFDAVEEFYDKEIVLGYGNGYFGADDSITYEHYGFLLQRLFSYTPENMQTVSSVREDIIVALVKALNLDLRNTDESIIEKTFSDCENLQPNNRRYIAAAIENGLVIGSDGKLFPQNNLTRTETVVILSRAINK